MTERELNVGVDPCGELKKAVTKGGPIQLGQDKVILCHLNSSMYLHSRKADGTIIGVKERASGRV